MNCYNTIFNEYAKKWKVDENTVQVIFLILDTSRAYNRTTRSLNQLGFNTTPRQLRYFYRKTILTQRYGNEKKIGSENYKKLVIKSS